MTMREVDALCERFYEAALDEALWDGALQAYGEAFGGVGTVILEPGAASPILSVSNGFRDGVEPYNGGWWRQDLVAATLERLDLIRPGVVWADDVLPFETRARNAFFQEFLRPFGIGSVGTVMAQPAGGPFLAINVERALARPPPGDEERRRFDRLSRHLVRALAIRMRLARCQASRHALGRTLLDFDCAVATTDSAGRVVDSNAAFAALAPDGLTIRSGRIHLAWRSAQGRFDAALRSRCGHGSNRTPDTLVLPRPCAALPLLARIVPLTGPASERLVGVTPTSGALVLVMDPAHRAYPDLAHVLGMLGLTPAQARVALLVAAGHPPRGVAQLLRIGEETVRSHLKAIFARLGMNRQSDLVRLVARSAPFGG